MRPYLRAGVVGLSLAATGCLGDGPREWASDIFSDKPKAPSGPPASTQTATRVHAIGTAIVAANRADLHGAKPVFFTVGVKEPMLFHRNDGSIVVSEGLVSRCGTDAELAACLSYELGKLAAKHAEASQNRSEADLPPTPGLTRDVVGNGSTPDQTRIAEAAMYDRRNPGRVRPGIRRPGPDPKTLAKNIYAKAGHAPEDYDRVADLIREAEDKANDREIMPGR